MPVEVRAAGGVVHRPSRAARQGKDADRGRELLVVHRPRYDDWTFPKGKLDPGETEAEAACREVAEETGLRCEPGAELALVSYLDQRGRAKTVRYWAMVVSADPGPGDGPEDPEEVDEVAWLAPDRVRELLTYDRDREVLDAFEAQARAGGLEG